MIIDLSYEYVGDGLPYTVKTIEFPLHSANTAYTGMIYEFSSGSMQGTYLDLPGHILETDDGRRAHNTPVEEFYRIPASVIHLNRASESGAVTAEDLAEAFGGVPNTKALIINALGNKNPMDIKLRTVFLDQSAVEWIIASGCRLLVSDIYESQAIEGVFLKLFKAGISTVCMPVSLAKLRCPTGLLTVLYPTFPELTQIPCRLVAEWD